MTTVTLSEAKTHLARLISEVQGFGEQFTITRSGHPAGVLLSVPEYEGLLETLEILADNELSQAIRVGLEESANGDVVAHEELWRDLEG